jgi:hypothetical protein
LEDKRFWLAFPFNEKAGSLTSALSINVESIFLRKNKPVSITLSYVGGYNTHTLLPS